MKMVKSLLLGSAAGLVAVAGAQAADLPVKAKAVEYVKVCSLYGAGFYYIPGTDTCIKIGGFLRAEWGHNTLGSMAVYTTGGQALYDRNTDVRDRARAIALGDIADTAEAAVAGAELIVLAMPVGAMADAIAAIAPVLAPSAIVTDVGSVKRSVAETLAPLAPAHAYLVPGHPIAGTEHSGPEAGFASLFKGRWHILTPLADARPEYAAAVDKLAAMELTDQGLVHLAGRKVEACQVFVGREPGGLDLDLPPPSGPVGLLVD